MISRTAHPEPSPLPTTASPGQPAAWQRELAGAVRSLGELLDLLDLDPVTVGASTEAHHQFPLRVPRGFVDRMTPGDPQDPLLLQVLPRLEETKERTGWSDDPLDEASHSPVPGLLQKYSGRALVVLTGACAIHCRYCFRRHFPYTEHATGGAAWDRIVEALAADPTLDEVLLSGGDPLSVTDAVLARRVADLESIPHLRRLRIHTRQPIVLPSRVDDDLLAWLTATRLRPVVVLHCNHPREIDGAVRAALERFRTVGIPVFNQSVLLRGINDHATTLCDLSKTLFESGVMPYYLHSMDRVRGAGHFEVETSIAKRLVEDVQGRLPGYLVPRLVRETPGALSKTPVF